MAGRALIRRPDLQFAREDVIAFGFTRSITAASAFQLVDGELSLVTQKTFESLKLMQMENRPRVVVLDLRAIQDKDFSSEAVVTDLLTLCKKWHRHYPIWVLLGVSGTIVEVFQVTRIDQLFWFVADEKELLELFQKKLPPVTTSQPTLLPMDSLALTVSSFHQEIIDDLRWAEEQYAEGHFAQYAGMHVAIIRKELKAAGNHVGHLLEEVHKVNPEVPVERIALFYVDPGDEVE
jgi:anti-anti-sigma regulatory factor